jgi:hypothetical protein
VLWGLPRWYSITGGDYIFGIPYKLTRIPYEFIWLLLSMNERAASLGLRDRAMLGYTILGLGRNLSHDVMA